MSKQNDRQSQHISNTMLKINNYTKNLSSMLNGTRSNKESLNKKSGHSHTFTHLNNPDSDKLSEIDSSFYHQPHKITKFRHSKSPSKERHVEHNNTSYADQRHAKIVFVPRTTVLQRSESLRRVSEVQLGGLMSEIRRLQAVIESYQSVLLKLKHKYLQMQQKQQEKVLNDHYIDVLKRHVEQLQQKNSELHKIIKTQRDTITNFQGVLISKVAQLHQHYHSRIEENIQLSRQNQYLKKILLIACDKTLPKSQTAPSEGQPVSSFLFTMSKSVEQFCNKWK